MARRASIYLNDELDQAVGASGIALTELVRRGLKAGAVYEEGHRQGRYESDLDHGDYDTDDREPGIPAGYVAPAGRAFLQSANCPHRGLSPGAFCKTCQSVVPERKGAKR